METAAARRQGAPALAIVRTPVLALAYAAAGLLVGGLAMPPGYVSPVWPAAGIALVAAMRWGWEAVPGVVLGSFLVNLSISARGGDAALGAAVLTALLIGLGAGAQAIVGARLARVVVGEKNPLESGASVPLFLLLGGPVACLVNTFWGTGVLLATGNGAAADIPAQLFTWWIGDTIGVLLIAPLLLASLAPPSVWGLRRWASLAVPLAVCLVGVIALFVETQRAVRAEAMDELEAQASLITSGFSASVSRAEAYTESIARAFGAIPALDRAAFRALVTPWLEANAAVMAFEWAPLVPGDARASFEAAARDAELPDYQVRELTPDGRLVPAGPRDVYMPLLFIEPLSREQRAVGYDLGSNPARLEALNAARDSGEVIATSGVRLVLHPGEWGALLVAAAYGGVEAPRDLAERRSELRGYVATVILVDELAHLALERGGEPSLVLRVTDLSTAPPQVLSGSAVGSASGVHTWSTVESVGGRRWRLEVICTDPSHASWLGWAVLAAGLACTGLVTAFVLDASARSVQIERVVGERTAALARANEALTRSNVELQRFAYVASHDMREPLRTIACYTELLERGATDRLDDASRGWLRRIINATRRMQELVTEILAISRLESRVDVLERVALAEPARAALDGLEAAVRESGATVLIDELPTVECDRIQMVQLFQNLLSNALKFRRPDVPPHIEVTGVSTGDGVAIAVRDNGIGIEPKHWERIFEMFQKLDTGTGYPGHGLGLSTCRRIVERHRGRIWVSSEPGVGSVFHFTLKTPT